MATTKYLDLAGNPIPKDSVVRQVDHFETTLVITIRSMGPMCGEDLKQHVQNKWEVLGKVQVTESKAFVS